MQQSRNVFFSKLLQKNRNYIHRIHSLQAQYASLDGNDFKNIMNHLKQSQLDEVELRTRVFALVKEAIKRVLAIELYDVQLLAGMALAEGKVAEMATGEGKTVMSVLPACWYYVLGKKVHIMTVNDYLAERDFEEMGKVFRFLGVTVGLNHSKLNLSEKQFAYRQNITYGVCNEFGFDYLKDHLVKSPNRGVQSKNEVVIVDEIDSILIDEAKTPLIISEKQKSPPDVYAVCSKLVSTMKEDEDYEIDLQTNQVMFTDRAIHRLEAVLMIENLYDGDHAQIFHFLLQSLRAHVFLKRDEHYIVKENEIQLIDSFTGRILDGRQYNDGLHQAIEAKEGLPLSEENGVRATITIQKLFTIYETVVGMTGTIKTEENELYELYGIEVAQIPTHKPVIREDLEDQIYDTTAEKYEAVLQEIKMSYKTGQPVLVGTTSVAQSEHFSKVLQGENIPHQLLNAKTEKEEAQMIARAGEKGVITIATNMAGRGTDIRLGEGVAELGGLYVIGTEKHESRRIDRQLRGRAGRQGDPGKSQFFLSLEDELMTRFAGSRLSKEKPKVLYDKIQKEVEQQNYAIRTIVYLLDSVIHDQRNYIYKHRKRVFDSTIFIETIRNHVIAHCKERINAMDIETIEQMMGNVDMTIEAFEQKEVNRWLEKLNKLTQRQVTILQQQYITLIDKIWAKHIDTLHHLKQSLHARVYEQRDPILIFHDEAWKRYEEMEEVIREQLMQQLSEMASTTRAPFDRKKVM